MLTNRQTDHRGHRSVIRLRYYPESGGGIADGVSALWFDLRAPI
jgi:hypothetical protein